jgi:predicted nucleotidyltransferase
MEIQQIISQVTLIIRKYLSKDYSIVLFGSFAKGDNLPTSDIDIGVVGTSKVPFPIMAKILREVDDIRTLRSIDVVDLLTLDEPFRANILSHAKEINS